MERLTGARHPGVRRQFNTLAGGSDIAGVAIRAMTMKLTYDLYSILTQLAGVSDVSALTKTIRKTIRRTYSRLSGRTKCKDLPKATMRKLSEESWMCKCEPGYRKAIGKNKLRCVKTRKKRSKKGL